MASLLSSSSLPPASAERRPADILRLRLRLLLSPSFSLPACSFPPTPTPRTCRLPQKATVAFTESELKPSIIPGVAVVKEERFHEHSLSWDTLQGFPKVELSGKVVLVRWDLSIFHKGDVIDVELAPDAVSTISYLITSGARIVIASHWSPFQSPNGLMDYQTIADCLSQHLDKKISAVNSVIGPAVKKEIECLSNGEILLLGNLKLYKEEVANDKDFAKELSQNIDILVNDAFSISHRVLASTVGIACFTRARLAGFQLERELLFLTKAISSPELPFIAVIGGSKFSLSIDVLSKLVDKCNSIIVIGSMVYTFFNSLGYYCPSSFVESNLVSDALKFLSMAAEKGVDVMLPVDFLCCNKDHAHRIFAADNISEGWWPVGLGPNTLENIQKTLYPSKMAMWIGPVSVSNQMDDLQASKLLARTFADITLNGCLTIVGGIEPTSALKREGLSSSVSHISRGGSAFIEVLKGANLPGVSALDFACPKSPDWERIYEKPELPLFVDIGCGNGLFILNMASSSRLPVNFLGLEIRKKLVDRCTCHALDQNLSNVYFLQADAATMFKRILSTYPAKVTFVAIQCPVPNFSNNDYRRRMVQKQLVEQIIDILAKDGKIFLQSDVKFVALQLREDFMEHGNGCIRMSHEHEDSSKCDDEGWLVENPYGVSTDWEAHVLRRGKRMYRTLLSRI